MHGALRLPFAVLRHRLQVKADLKEVGVDGATHPVPVPRLDSVFTLPTVASPGVRFHPVSTLLRAVHYTLFIAAPSERFP
jgi:hypothetical protein